MQARRTLVPGQKGTKKFLDHCGEKLICVRYRYDEQQRKRVTTVEIIVEESAWIPPVTPIVEPVIVGLRVGINPSQFEVIRKSANKTDRHDARALAQFLQKDLLPESRLKDKTAAQMESLCQSRQKLVELRTTLINKVHPLHRARGIESKKSEFSSEKGLKAVLDREWDVLERVELEIIISQLRSLEDNIKKLEKQIAENGRQMEGHRNLRSIKGIRYKSAAILLSVIGNVNDLADEEKLASYFGIVPRVSNSNETVHHGRITNTARSLDKQRWCNARWWLSNTATT